MTTPLTVDIWSDIACPWCYIGKRKFEQGLAAFPDADDVVVSYHSFELSPDTPVDFEGSTADFLSAHKGLPAQQVEQMLGQVAEIASSVGLTYDFSAVRQTKTLLAHEALHHAKAHGKQLELVERLFAAYFVEGRHVGHLDELVALASDVGLDAEDVRRALTTHEHGPAVQADIDQARAYGIQGVPFFVIDGRYGISGAQSAETFTAALARVQAERATAGAS